MDLSHLGRRRYTTGFTPIERLPRLSERLMGSDIYIKRDDFLGLTGGGNKTRKLEFVVADALSQHADTLITSGAVQSNHCRLTLAAAVREGLKCRVLLEQRVPNSYHPEATGNNLLFHLLGAENITVLPNEADMAEEMAKAADEVRSQGGKPYAIPGGTSTPLGAVGHVAGASEILNQSLDMGVAFDSIVCATGSGGTQAGLIAGLHGESSHTRVIGINIRRPSEQQKETVLELARKTADYLKIAGNILEEAVICLDEYLGPGYSLPTDEMVEAVRLLARTEGILLDPTYTGKAMAGLIGLARQGYFKKGEKVLFIHTGGVPALFAYSALFLKSPQSKR
jgi:D-cysteine desulfhydrase